MVTHVLDTSAWLAHLFGEPGHEAVADLIEDPEVLLGVSAASLLEVHARMAAVHAVHRFDEVIAGYSAIFASILPIDETVALQAAALREAATARVPAIDALIAATAATHDAFLIHRDPHFSAIPYEQVRQVVLVVPE